MQKLANIGFFESLGQSGCACSDLSVFNASREEVEAELMDYIESLDIDGQAGIYWEYCMELANDPDSGPMDLWEGGSFDDCCSGYAPTKILEMTGIRYGDYVNFDGYGHLKTWEGIDDVDEVVDSIISSNYDCNDDDIRAILDTLSE